MAKALNKNRMRNSKLLLLLTFIFSLITIPSINPDSGLGEAMEVCGFILLSACAIGRIYSTIFIGGVKSEKLVTTGPYSICRNPLYFFSVCGAAGAGLMSGRFTLFIFLLGGFLLMYHFLIRREEEFLREKFGADFKAFCASTPRLIPNFKKFSAPGEISVQTKYVNKAVWDAAWWLAASPIFETIEYLHNKGIVKPLLTLF